MTTETSPAPSPIEESPRNWFAAVPDDWAGWLSFREEVAETPQARTSLRDFKSASLEAGTDDLKLGLGLCAAGEVLWVGAGRLGARDGKVRLVLRQHAGALLAAPEALPADASPLAIQLDEELQSRGASFLVALDTSENTQDPGAIEEALA